MIRVVIIDDEQHILRTLKKLLADHCPSVEVVGEAGGVEEGFVIVQAAQPDLVLLDIKLSDGTAFDFLRKFPSIDFRIIFITAYDEFAVQAFKFSAVDYLLKPVNPLDLIDALNRAAGQIRQHHAIQLKALEENSRTETNQKKKLILKTAEKIYVVELKDIVTCESDSSYTKVHTAGGEKIMVTRTLKEYEEMLEDYGFYRVHKSFLVNFDHIRQFDKQDGGYVILSNKLRVPVSFRRREELLRRLEELAG